MTADAGVDLAAPRRFGGLRSLRRLSPLLRLALIIGAWSLVSRTLLAGTLVLPSPDAVATQLWRDRSIYPANIDGTLREAVPGFLIGNGLATLAAIMFVQVRALERVLMPIAVASYCLPGIAIAPILQIVLPGNEPKIALAALFVFFTTLVTVLAGLRSADPISLDLVRAYGGGSLRQLRKVRVYYSLPYLARALQLAAPSAILGAIIGEFLGGRTGLGVLMIQAQADLNVPRTWGVLIVTGCVAGGSYVLLGLGGRRLRELTPERSSLEAELAPTQARGSRVPGARALVEATLTFALPAVVAIGVWYGALRVLHLDPYFAKGPGDVWSYVVSGSDASANRSVLFGALATTLRDASIGFGVGLAFGWLLAVAIVFVPRLEREVMPWAVTLRAIPLVAIAPLMSVEFGRGLVAVMVLCALVTFFPTLVLVIGGLRAPVPAALELVRAYGGGAWQETRKVRIPTAVPALFASARIAAPSALLAAEVI